MLFLHKYLFSYFYNCAINKVQEPILPETPSRYTYNYTLTHK